MKPHTLSSTHPIVRWACGALVAALVLVLLVVGRSFLVPLVLGLLITSMVSALVERLRAWQWRGYALPGWLASVLAVALLACGFLLLYSVVVQQANVLVREGPVFWTQIQQSVLTLAGHLHADLADALAQSLARANPSQWFRWAAESLGGWLATVVLVAIYVGFLLAERPWVYRKLKRLFPQPAQHARVAANIAAIRHNVHHYLLLKTLISGVTALVIYAVARMFGLQFALLIALLTFFLNFIPTLGSLVATSLPVLVALVQFEGTSLPWVVLAVVGGVQFVLGNIVDPMVTGRGLQMSSLAIVVSLTLWSAMWGVVGMFLAVPLMVILMIICAQVRPLRPVAVLLSQSGAVADVLAPYTQPGARRASQSARR